MIRRRAPAKLNLYLRILGRRPDGYHEIETLFERVDLADELTFEPAPGELQLTCSDPSLSCGEDNLVLKAACLLQDAGGIRQARPPGPSLVGAGAGGNRDRRAGGARIHLVKRIPIAAGLGGGSSDAATTLIGLNDLWRLGMDRARLTELAGQLGADVPFFLLAVPFAIGRGRGERCEPVAEAVELTHVVVTPPERLSTKDVYEGFARGARSGSRDDLTRPAPSISMVGHALSNGSLSELAAGLWNDLEPEAIRRCPSISLIQLELQKLGCLAARVSGSGPSVFGLCTDAAHAQDIATRLRRSDPSWRVEVLQTARSAQGVPHA